MDDICACTSRIAYPRLHHHLCGGLRGNGEEYESGEDVQRRQRVLERFTLIFVVVRHGEGFEQPAHVTGHGDEERDDAPVARVPEKNTPQQGFYDSKIHR